MDEQHFRRLGTLELCNIYQVYGNIVIKKIATSCKGY